MSPESFWWGGMWVFPIFMICFIGFVFYLILGKNSRNISCTGTHIGVDNESAMDILKKRYAKGEISKEEFDKIKQDIS